MTITPQPPKKGRWYQAWYHFKHSNYITWLTDWFLTLGGKSAHSILIGTTLYMSAELYPGVSLPAALNMAVFLAQMFALDMGGMGLATLARQARADGNEDGADKAQKLSNFLIAIMIAGIVTVCVEQAISNFSLTADVQAWINAIKIIIEVSLVVSRAFCAVLYGVVIHALHADKAIHQQTQQNLQQEVADLTSTITALQQQQVAGLQSEQEQVERLHQQLESEQETTLTLHQQLNASHLQIVDLSAEIEGANREIAILQKGEKQVAELATKLQEKEQECESLKAQIVKLRQSESVKAHVKGSAKSVKSGVKESVKREIFHHETDGLSQGNITSLDQARVKVKASASEILAYMKEHPTLKVSEIANHFEVTPRTIYNVLKRQSVENESEDYAAPQP